MVVLRNARLFAAIRPDFEELSIKTVSLVIISFPFLPCTIKVTIFIYLASPRLFPE